MDINKTLKKRPAFTTFIILLAGLYSGAFIDIRILLTGFSLAAFGYFVRKTDILLILVLFLTAGIYQKSRTPVIGKRIFFRGIYLDNRIIDPFWGELYSSLPANAGDLVKGSGIFVKDIGFFKLVDTKSNKSSATFLNKLFSLRNSLDRKLKKNFPGDIGEMCSAITLGMRNSLPPYMYRRFQACGAAHLLAVSGLHTGIVFALVFLFLKAIQLKRNPAFLLSEIFVLMYAVFTGFRLPTLRASIMLLFFVIGEFREKNIDPFNILSSAGILIVLIMPRSIFGISFQLSFIAVFSILIMLNFIKKPLEKITNNWFKKWIIIPFLITLSAQLGTLPLSTYYFGYIPLMGLIVNLILIPLTGILISSCLLFLMFPFMGNITGNFVYLIGFTMNKFMIIVEKIPFTVLKIPKNNSKILILYLFYFISLFVWEYRRKKKISSTKF